MISVVTINDEHSELKAYHDSNQRLYCEGLLQKQKKKNLLMNLTDIFSSKNLTKKYLEVTLSV